ncbi:hypothetical protein BO85DRAFT_475916 [Aspergillus piperis CBS 112811]|uniref:Uncharacterized protein n=1 Tax=Aspergillus piperis CBS 112811 TaxID=1448313 RepID=A0A8G1R6K8_9EURO|nr:hypothetical protein BO85DRAFT_475916 [Aspergillus piperis CBS 112811]RAH60508.1 hypothetical protein BO85DRAFT_475916 [Aspergillus piperis CBS 112811]
MWAVCSTCLTPGTTARSTQTDKSSWIKLVIHAFLPRVQSITSLALSSLHTLAGGFVGTAAAATDKTPLRPGKARRAVGRCYHFFGERWGAKLKRWALDTGGLCWKARVMPVTVSLGLSRFSSDQPLWRPRRVGGVWASG